MGTVVVDVMLKPEILDTAGRAVEAALHGFGFSRFSGVRLGKRFVLEVAGEVTDEVLADARRAATSILSNPAIEDVASVRAAAAADDAGVDWDEFDQAWGGDAHAQATPGRRASPYARPANVDAHAMDGAHDAFGVEEDDD